MSKELTRPIEQEEWYQHLILECQAIMTEGLFSSRWMIIQTYHNLGQRLLEEYNNFERRKIYGKAVCERVANSLGKSKRSIERAVQFAREFPELDKLPEGKNISWAKICKKYLPKKKDKENCPHPDRNRHYYYQCGLCEKWVLLKRPKQLNQATIKSKSLESSQTNGGGQSV